MVKHVRKMHLKQKVNHLKNTTCEVNLGFNDPQVQVYPRFSVNRKGEAADGCRE